MEPLIGKVWISGPMTGMPSYNYPAFHRLAAELRQQKVDVINPAESHGGDVTLPYSVYMREDIRLLLDVDAVVVLPGWRKSVGAVLEVSVAVALGLPIYTADGGVAGGKVEYPAQAGREALMDVLGIDGASAESVLEEAQRLVHGARQADYGHPLEDFGKTAQMWSAIFGVSVTPEQVALAMICVKISRQLNAPKRDNIVDGCGYFATLDMVIQERNRREQTG